MWNLCNWLIIAYFQCIVDHGVLFYQVRTWYGVLVIDLTQYTTWYCVFGETFSRGALGHLEPSRSEKNIYQVYVFFLRKRLLLVLCSLIILVVLTVLKKACARWGPRDASPISRSWTKNGYLWYIIVFHYYCCTTVLDGHCDTTYAAFEKLQQHQYYCCLDAVFCRCLTQFGVLRLNQPGAVPFSKNPILRQAWSSSETTGTPSETLCTSSPMQLIGQLVAIDLFWTKMESQGENACCLCRLSSPRPPSSAALFLLFLVCPFPVLFGPFRPFLALGLTFAVLWC